MILFKNDWEKYPQAIVDTETKNESFLRLAALYAKMGIQNNAFILQLLQPSLQGVDPFSPDLTSEQKVSIALECKWNWTYALREIIQLPPQGDSNPIHYIANRANIAMAWCFFNHIDFGNVQPRQSGKSASTDSLWAIVLFLMGSNTDIQLITKDNKVRRSNVLRLKGIIEYLPSYLNPTNSKDADNTEAVTCVARGNHYKTAVGLAGKEAADMLGRGLTSPVFHGDEIPYIPNVHISLPVALSSGTAARENVARVGGMYGNIFTTTAGKLNTDEGKWAYKLIFDGLYWNEKLFDARDRDSLVSVILKNSKSSTPMINGTFSHRQLGKTDEWLRAAIANARASEELANRDYFNVWTAGTESSPIDTAILETIKKSEIEPVYIEVTHDRYMFKWYIGRNEIMTRMANGQFVLSLDSSNAVGKDNNGLTLLDTKNMAMIASASISEANLYKFAVWIANLLIQYENVIFVIENKSSAQGIIDVLLTVLPHNGIDPFKRIYNRLIENIEEYPDEEEELNKPLSRRKESFYLRHKSKFGFMTTSNSRAFLYDTVLQESVKSVGHLVRDMVLSSELAGLITKNGKVIHPVTGHDDSVISWLLGNYFIRHSKNLHRYSMKTSQLLSEVSSEGYAETDEMRIKRGKRNQIKLDIEKIAGDIAQSTTPSERIKLEYLLKRKVTEIETYGEESISLDAILNEAKHKGIKKKTLYEAIRNLRN